jgi:hypothetical protein
MKSSEQVAGRISHLNRQQWIRMDRLIKAVGN